MTHEQFTFWLKGFLETKESLTKKEIEVIKAKAQEICIFDTISTIPATPSYWQNPYIVTCGTINGPAK